MLDYDEAMRLLKDFGVCVVGNGTLFVDESTARAVAKAHGTEPIEIRSLEPSAWLVRNAKDDDPRLIEVIKEELVRHGLTPD